MAAVSSAEPSSTTRTSKPGSDSRTSATTAAMCAASLYAGMTTRQFDELTGPRATMEEEGTTDCNVRGAQRFRASWQCSHVGVCEPARPHADLPGLRLPVPVDRRRRGAVDAQRRRGAGRRRAPGHLSY